VIEQSTSVQQDVSMQLQAEQSAKEDENYQSLLNLASSFGSEKMLSMETSNSNLAASSLTNPISSTKSSKLDDDQDKKIKTLADNIIAAMPHKIKTNSYSNPTKSDSVGNSATNLSQQQQQNGDNIFKPINILRRETTSFDDNYDPGISLSSCYSSSTRSSISPSSSLSYQFTSHEPIMNQFNRTPRFIDDSQQQFSPANDESTCSSTFHIDSPPSTAEFCQYFHAGSSSVYYRNAIETGFAQLTLTDDEQRELYEAALVIQNAYRRYIQRKKKKIRLNQSEKVEEPKCLKMDSVNLSK
jgi:hypothetical protein